MKVYCPVESVRADLRSAPDASRSSTTIFWRVLAGSSAAFTCPQMVVPHGGGLMVRDSVAVPVPPALVALKATLEAPAAAGVPEIRPVTVLTDRMAGRPVAL